MRDVLTWNQVAKKYGQDIADWISDCIYSHYGAYCAHEYGVTGWGREEIEGLVDQYKEEN
jgi:hypothetical protein